MTETKILIVEDNLVIARSIKLILEQEGYTVCSIAISHEEALEAVQKEMPDIVLMDIDLKGIDGIHTAKMLKEQFDLKIIYCTDAADKHTFNIAKETFPAHYITKPFSNEELLRAVALAAQTEKHIPISSVLDDDTIWFEIKGVYKSVSSKDILYIEANGPYTTIFTESGKTVLSIGSNHVIKKLASTLIIKVHRSYHINIRKVESLHPHKVCIGGKDIPIAHQYRDSLFSRFNILKKERK